MKKKKIRKHQSKKNPPVQDILTPEYFFAGFTCERIERKGGLALVKTELVADTDSQTTVFQKALVIRLDTIVHLGEDVALQNG